MTQKQKHTSATPTILLVEDDKVMLQVLKMRFQAEGWVVTTCSNGEQAITTLNQETFDIIVCDIIMPYKNGLDVLRACTGTSNEETPIVMLTSLDQNMNDEAMKLGATLCIQKGATPLHGVVISIQNLLSDSLYA